MRNLTINKWVCIYEFCKWLLLRSVKEVRFESWNLPLTCMCRDGNARSSIRIGSSCICPQNVG